VSRYRTIFTERVQYLDTEQVKIRTLRHRLPSSSRPLSRPLSRRFLTEQQGNVLRYRVSSKYNCRRLLFHCEKEGFSFPSTSNLDRKAVFHYRPLVLQFPPKTPYRGVSWRYHRTDLQQHILRHSIICTNKHRRFCHSETASICRIPSLSATMYSVFESNYLVNPNSKPGPNPIRQCGTTELRHAIQRNWYLAPKHLAYLQCDQPFTNFL